MRNQGLGSWTLRRARMTPSRVALVHGQTRLTYRELHERVLRLAQALRGLGVRHGDRVAYLGPNHPSYLETLFAAGALGAVFVPLNFRLTSAEIDYALGDSGASVLVYAPDQAGVVAGVDRARTRHRIALADPPADDHDYADLLARAAPEPVDERVELGDTCLIMYTSGSTGRPKGAVLTHGNLTWNCVNVLVESDLAHDEVSLVVAPLFHAAALGMICLPTLLKGGTVLLRSSFDPGAVLAAIERHRVTLMFGVPTMYNAMAAHPDWPRTDLSSVRALLCGGAPVPVETIRRYTERGLAFVQGYGMTEAAPGALILDREHTASKIGSAGVPSFFTDVRVVRPDGSEVGPGEKGEVVVSGPNVMRGYWGRAEETAGALRDGWFHSGDVATVDEDGYAYIVDRVKDVIISGGENIYPAEVENALYEHDAVELCAVIGVPDQHWGEVGRAVVVTRPDASVDEAELLGFLRQRLAGYKVPKSVRFADALPVTGSGKLRKTEIRRRFGQQPPPDRPEPE
ncbi:acyl-CoA synthetase [Goodfellowiella coeruleoviolacea]|uniref:Fatty-acyl-CoA synthase n=1 Tax=Goodfellowiella coeruleoviolacea TaxID=334858 RepID=A0AAE3G9I7_9PSEU|nr:long-chain fatty acid--CoA ligase [Goodfellowiella coeruleoviolacea]MCP2164035.1 fatty-acyl-CoA synthase [Goodfellowiella coeruleoviolacea]